MTTIEAIGKVHTFFMANDTFCLQDDFKEFFLISEDVPRDKAVLLTALTEFEKAGVVTCQKCEGKDFWVLKQNFKDMEQKVSISAGLANLISGLVNDLCEEMNHKDKMCNPLEIKEKDISFVIYVLADLLTNKKSK